MTPTKEQIHEKALELWGQNRLRNGQPYDITPEENELNEEGFLMTAQQELMRSESSEYKNYIEKEANELGLNLCPYQDRYCALHRVAEKNHKPLIRKDGELLLTCIETPNNSTCKGKMKDKTESNLYRLTLPKP